MLLELTTRYPRILPLRRRLARLYEEQNLLSLALKERRAIFETEGSVQKDVYLLYKLLLRTKAFGPAEELRNTHLEF